MFNILCLLNKNINSVGIKFRIIGIQAHGIAVIIVNPSLPIDDVEGSQHLIRNIVAVSAVKLFYFPQDVDFIQIESEIFWKKILDWKRIYFL